MIFDLIIRNATAATMTVDRPFGLIENAAIGVQKGRIAFIGSEHDLPDDADALNTFYAQGNVVTPGLFDHHTHVVHVGNGLLDFQMLMRGASRDDIAAAGGGVGGMVARSRAATETEFYEESAPRLRSMISAGVTTVESKSGCGLDLETELRQMRVSRALERDFPVTIQSTYLGAHGLPAEYTGRRDDYVSFMIDEVLPAAMSENLVDAVDGFCDVIGFSPDQMGRLFDVAAKLGLPVKLHADQYNESAGGLTAARYGGLSADHLEYASIESVRAMAGAGTVAGLLPGANWTLRESHVPPIERFREYGVPMCLATNCNPISSPTTMPTMIMNMGCVRFGLTTEEALAGFTRHAAKALGKEEDIGTLEVGKAADFAVWAVRHPAELSYRIACSPCNAVIKAGRFSYRAPAIEIVGNGEAHGG